MGTYFKKAAALLLTAALTISPVLAVSAPAGWVSPFRDVKEGDWYYPFVGSLNSRGVINGYDDGRFGAGDATRAGDAIIMVVKAAGSGDLEPLMDTHYAMSYVRYAVNHGWMDESEVPAELNGTAPRLFIARLAARALGLSPAERGPGLTTPSPFADADDGYLTALYQRDIVAGNLENGQRLFKPRDPITRAELSAIIYRVMEYAGSKQTGLAPNPYDAGAFVMKDGRMTYTGAGVKAELGIDVSYHAGDIDWSKVAADGVKFVMIRAAGRGYGESGRLYEDSKFHTYMEGALAAGLDVGVYFFSQAVSAGEGREEAQYLLERLKGYDFQGPVVFDWENIDYDEARTDGADARTVTAAALAFCQEVEGAGYRPMLYFSRHIAETYYELEQVAQYPFWVAEYRSSPIFQYDFEMWQYTEKGAVDGIQADVDMDLRLTKE